MKRSLLVMVAVLMVGIGAGAVWGRHLVETRDQGGEGTGSADGPRVTTTDGRLSVDLPTGWKESACPGDGGNCLLISPAGAGMNDDIMVSVSALEKGHGSTYEFYRAAVRDDAPANQALRQLTIDGMNALWIDPAQLPRVQQDTGPPPSFVLVTGEVPPAGTAEFVILCRYDQHRSEIRSGCDTVAASLRVRR